MPKPAFEHSKELKHFFNEQYEIWKKRNHAGMEDLAKLCGVSSSYLSHVGRYGRVPGKPVLILLAFNFGLETPQKFFEAAGITDPWPYDGGIGLRAQGADASGLLSVRLDMSGFTSAIREIVRAELRPRTVQELTRGRPLRVGFNFNQGWFFNHNYENKTPASGLFPELFHMLTLSLQARCDFQPVNYMEVFQQFREDKLDIYGPIFSTPPRIGQALLSQPFCRVPMVGVGRKRKATALEPLPAPQTVEELQQNGYQVAVLRDSNSHHLAQSLLDGSKACLIICDTPEEALERITLSGIARPAHLMFADSLVALQIMENHPNEYELLFNEQGKALGYFENTIAVRPDWPELLSILNEALAFINRSNSLHDLLGRYVKGGYKGAIEQVAPH